MEKAIVLAILMVSVIAYVQSKEFTRDCMKCICEVEGCQGQVNKCRDDMGTDSCGPYQIKNPYYQDCGSPGKDWRSCTKKMSCSEICVKVYMKKYGKGCPAPTTCEDYARIHNGGPNGCRSSSTLGYWKKVQKCCARQGKHC
jgi:hypothetical protein